MISDYLENEDGDPLEDIVVSRETFESLIRPLIQRTIDLIEELLVKNKYYSRRPIEYSSSRRLIMHSFSKKDVGRKIW